MDYQELKRQIDELEGVRRAQYRQVMSLAALGGNVRPEFRAHLEVASDYRAFFDALYEDDSLRFTRAWAAWAKLAGKDWIGRFQPEHAVGNVVFGGRGLPVEFAGGGTLLVPTGGRGKTARVYVFDDGAFNESAATYFTSLDGAFTCARIEFDGVYDVFAGDGAVVFERWRFNENGQRAKAADLAREYRLTG